MFIEQWLIGSAETATPEEWLPQALEEIIVRRAARVSTQAQVVAQVAAVLGVTFSLELVREVIGWNERQTLDALGALLDHQLIGEAASTRPARMPLRIISYAPRSITKFPTPTAHAVIIARHASMEETFAARLDEFAAELARHYDRGGDPEPAAQYAARGAQRAAVYADQDALTLIAHAVELASEVRLRFELSALAEIAPRGGAATVPNKRHSWKRCAFSPTNYPMLTRAAKRSTAPLGIIAPSVNTTRSKLLSTRSKRLPKGCGLRRVLRHRATYEILRGQYDTAHENALAAQPPLPMPMIYRVRQNVFVCSPKSARIKDAWRICKTLSKKHRRSPRIQPTNLFSSKPCGLPA